MRTSMFAGLCLQPECLALLGSQVPGSPALREPQRLYTQAEQEPTGLADYGDSDNR